MVFIKIKKLLDTNWVDTNWVNTNWVDTNWVDTNWVDTNWVDTNWVDTNWVVYCIRIKEIWNRSKEREEQIKNLKSKIDEYYEDKKIKNKNNSIINEYTQPLNKENNIIQTDMEDKRANSTM